MLKKLRLKRLKTVLKSSITQIILLIILVYFANSMNVIDNLKAIDINSADSFKDNVERRVKFKPTYIVNYYAETVSEDTNKTLSISYIGYDYESGKHFGIEVDKDEVYLFEQALQSYNDFEFEQAEKITPILEGTISKMDSEEKGFFNDAIKTVLKEDMLINSISEIPDEELQNMTEEELENLLNEMETTIEQIEITDEELLDNSIYYYVDLKSESHYIGQVVLFSLLIALFSLILIYKLIRLISYNRFFQLTEKIDSNFNIRQEELENDFKNSININDLWIGNNFSIFLTNKSADFIKNENIIWIYGQEEKKHNKYERKTHYQIVFIDNEYNEYIVNITKKDMLRVLKMYEGKYPNLLIGYNEQLEQLIRVNPQEIFNFNKEEVKLPVIRKI